MNENELLDRIDELKLAPSQLHDTTLRHHQAHPRAWDVLNQKETASR